MPPAGEMNERPIPHIDIDAPQNPRKINYYQMKSSGERRETSMKAEENHIKVSFHRYVTVIEARLQPSHIRSFMSQLEVSTKCGV